MRRSRLADGAGFALVDLLVAMAVAGLAGSILVGLVAFVERSNAATVRRAQEHHGALAVERILRIFIDNAAPIIPGTPLLSTIAGDEKELIIMSNGPPIVGLPQAASFRLRREDHAALSQVMLSWTDEEGKQRNEPLARNVSAFTIAYLPRAEGRGAGNWQPRWSAQEGALNAVRVKLRFAGAPEARTFVIPILTDLPASCLRQTRQAGCTGGGAS
jgi:hypothetical protein